MDFGVASRTLAAGLVPGDHRLTDDRLRDLYGLAEVTPEARARVAASLGEAGLQVLSDPAQEPLVVRRSRQTGAVAASTRKDRVRARRPWYQRPWAITVGAFLALLLLVGALSSPETPTDNEQAAATQTPTPTPTSTPTPTPTPTSGELIAQAEEEIEDDDYPAAIALVAALSNRDRSRVRRAISRRIASRARSALRRGDRARARSLLRQSRRYPATPQSRQAVSALAAADARATQRAQARKVAREQRAAARRQRAAARREARRQAQAERDAAESAPDDSAPSVGEGTCAEVGETNFPVPPGDERDADGDGIACES